MTPAFCRHCDREIVLEQFWRDGGIWVRWTHVDTNTPECTGLTADPYEEEWS